MNGRFEVWVRPNGSETGDMLVDGLSLSDARLAGQVFGGDYYILDSETGDLVYDSVRGWFA